MKSTQLLLGCFFFPHFGLQASLRLRITFAALGFPGYSLLKMQTLHRPRRCGFVFHRSLQTRAPDATPKNKTPQHLLRGLRFK